MKIITCEEVKKDISIYLEGTLQLQEMENIRTHLDVCEKCRKEADELNKIICILNDVSEAPVPDRFEMEFKRALKYEIVTTKKRKKAKWKAMSAIAAVLVVSVISFAMIQDGLQIFTQDLAKNQVSEGASGSVSLPAENYEDAAVSSGGMEKEKKSIVENNDAVPNADDAAVSAYRHVAPETSGTGRLRSVNMEDAIQDQIAPLSGPSDEIMPGGSQSESAIVSDSSLSRGGSYFSTVDEYNNVCKDWITQFTSAVNTKDSALFADIVAKGGINGYTTDTAIEVLKLYEDYLGTETVTYRQLRSNTAKMENSYIIEGTRNHLRIAMKTTSAGLQVMEPLLSHGPWLSDQLSGTNYSLDSYQVRDNGNEILFNINTEDSQADGVATDSGSDEQQVKEIVWKKTE